MLAVLKPGSNDKLPVESVPAEAIPVIQPAEKIASAAAIPAPETPTIAAPETPSIAAPAPAAPAQEAPAQAAPAPAAQEQPSIAAQEISPEKEALRLVGKGIENCGPARVRNASGICEQAT